MLSDFECKKKDSSGVYLDLCSRCIRYTKEDLRPANEPVEDTSTTWYDDGEDNDI